MNKKNPKDASENISIYYSNLPNIWYNTYTVYCLYITPKLRFFWSWYWIILRLGIWRHWLCKHSFRKSLSEVSNSIENIIPKLQLQEKYNIGVAYKHILYMFRKYLYVYFICIYCIFCFSNWKGLKIDAGQACLHKSSKCTDNAECVMLIIIKLIY